MAVGLTAVATPADASCSPAFRHIFDGAAGTVRITAVCVDKPQTFALISYTTSARGQFVYDSARGTITPSRRSITLDVAVPACAAQVDAIIGTAVRDEITSTGSAPYGSATLGAAGSRSTGALAWHAGGTSACTALPRVTYTNSCDGFTATLANDASATVQAVFLHGSRRVRLSPGRSTTIKAATNATLTIRASDFTTYVGTWRAPSTPCAVPTQPVATRPAAAPVAAPVPAATAPTSAAPTTAASFIADPPDPVLATSRSAEPATALAAAGMGPGSVIAIAAGLLMIAGGVTVLTRIIRMR